MTWELIVQVQPPSREFKVGDLVKMRLSNGTWVDAKIEEEREFVIGMYWRGRRTGKTRGNRRYSKSSWMKADPFKIVKFLDPLVSNVYADFLEARGFEEAADALRKAFPLGPLKE